MMRVKADGAARSPLMLLDLGHAGDVRSPECVIACHCVLVANGNPLAQRGLLCSQMEMYMFAAAFDVSALFWDHVA